MNTPKGGLTLIALPLALGLAGCAADSIKESAYQAAYQKGCMDRTGTPDCDPEHHSYDDYRKAREQLLEPGSDDAPPP